MKKFVFRLESLRKVKLALEKEQKARLLEAQEALRELLRALEALQLRQDQISRDYQEETRGGITSERLHLYGYYFDHLRDSISEQEKRIEEARAEKARRQAALIRTMKEIKALNKLREAQYAQYLADVAKEEEQAIGDIVSFRAVTSESAAF